MAATNSGAERTSLPEFRMLKYLNKEMEAILDNYP